MVNLLHYENDRESRPQNFYFVAIVMYAVTWIKNPYMPWRRGLVVSSPPATEETGAMGRGVESRQGIG
jgi:hypothetical protein